MAITTAVYGGGPFYTGDRSALENLKYQGFSTIVCWALHVNSKGDLIFNDSHIVTNGQYVGDPNWPQFLANLKEGGDVNRILVSVGGWGVQDFFNIQALIKQFGEKSGPLFESFKVLHDTIPAIDGIDFDDESLYDHNTTVEFAQLLANVGFKEVTFCPYMQAPFWVGCLQTLQQTNPGLVTAFNLQCYAGGSPNLNNVGYWIDQVKTVLPSNTRAAEFIVPGLWCKHGAGCTEGMDPNQIQQQFSTYKPQGIEGGFIWLYDNIQQCGNDPKSYSQAILNGLQ